MNFNFGEVLTRAWQIIWKHKILWIFGVFAGCSRGGGGGSGGGGGGNGFDFSGQPPFSGDQVFNQIGQWVSENLWIFVVIAIVVLILVVLAILLGTIGRIGLIKGTYQAEQGTEKLVFGELFSGSMPYFWRVFGLSLLIGLVFLVILIPFIFFGVITAGIGMVCLLPLICILIPIGLVVGVIIEQANAAIVLDDLSMMDGLRRGWEVVRSNIGPVLLMAIILAVIGFVVGLVIAIPIFVTVFPVMLAYFAGGGESNTPWILLGVCVFLYLPIALVLQGIMTAYIESAWTLTYMRLTKSQDNVPMIPEANA